MFSQEEKTKGWSSSNSNCSTTPFPSPSLPAKSHHHQYSSASTLGTEEIAGAEFCVGASTINEKWKKQKQQYFEEVEGKNHIFTQEVTAAAAEAAFGVLPPPRYSQANSFADFVAFEAEGAEEPFEQQLREVASGGFNEFDFEEIPIREGAMVSGSMNLPQRLDNIDQQQQQHLNYSHRGVSGICGVGARLSGLVSFAVQTVVLVLSCLLVGLLFVHAGGYKYFNRASDGTTFSVAEETFLVLEPEGENSTATTMAEKNDDDFPKAEALLSSSLTAKEPDDGNIDLLPTSLANGTEDTIEQAMINTTDTLAAGDAGQVDETLLSQENQVAFFIIFSRHFFFCVFCCLDIQPGRT